MFFSLIVILKTWVEQLGTERLVVKVLYGSPDAGGCLARFQGYRLQGCWIRSCREACEATNSQSSEETPRTAMSSEKKSFWPSHFRWLLCLNRLPRRLTGKTHEQRCWAGGNLLKPWLKWKRVHQSCFHEPLLQTLSPIFPQKKSCCCWILNAALCTVLTKPEASICSQHQTNLSCSCQIRALVNTWHKTLSKKCYSSISLLFPVNSVPQAVSMNPPRHPSPESSCRSMQESSAKPQEKDQLPSTFRMVCTIHPTSVDVFRSI